MRIFAQLFVIISLLGILYGCVSRPPTLESNPTATAEPEQKRTATATQSKSTDGQKTFTIGNARFLPQSIIVEHAAVAAADLNNDGHLDLVGSGEPNLTIFLGDGKGNLTPLYQVPGGEQPDEFTLTDLDHDGDADIVIANHDTDHLTILLGDGSGEFQSAPYSPFRIDVSPHPHVVQAADIDTDGRVDLIVDHRDGEGVLILRGLVEGSFESPGTLVEVGGDPYRGMAIGDINSDGKLDIVTPNPSNVGVILNASQEGIGFIQGTSVAAEAPFAVGLGDFNGDGRLDLITGSDEGSPHVELLLGDGTGGFEQADGSPFNLAPGAKKIIVGDFNGDSIHDAAIASYHHPQVLVVLGGRDSLQTGFLPGGEHPWGLAAADFNEDGKEDLVIADDAEPKAAVYLSIQN